MSIRERVLARQKELFIAGLTFLLATLSFGLGYAARTDQQMTQIIIRKCGP